MTSPVVVVACLGSTAFFALATALKHRGAGHVPDAQDLSARRLARFIAATVRHPLWLGGLLADAGGLSLQVYALHIGALAVVQPLLVTALVFSLCANHWLSRTRITGFELAWATVLVAALAGFLVVSGAASPSVSGPAQQPDRLPALLAAVGASLVGGGLVLAARRLPRGRGAAMMGVAVGLVYAFTAALIKGCTNVLAGHGVPSLLASWQLYVLLLVGAGGLVLTQLTFQAGPLTTSLPVIATVDPLVSVALGVLVYDERLRSSTGYVLGELVCLATLCAAAVFIGRLPIAAEAMDDAIDADDPIGGTLRRQGRD